jgi:hypothetical protein
MNVTARWCGFDRSPADNFREVVRAFIAGTLLFRELSVLDVSQDGVHHRCFTFGMGPIVRLIDAYERGDKGKLAALATAGRGITAALMGRPSSHARLLEPLRARVVVDGAALPYQRYSALFANVTGQINPGVVPFVGPPTRNTFHYAAYAVSAREFTVNVLGLMRGWLPVDPRSLARPDRVMRRLARARPIKGGVPADPRYVNANARRLEIESAEPLFTVDGEILPSRQDTLQVSLGLQVRLAVSGRTSLLAASAMAARRRLGRD